MESGATQCSGPRNVIVSRCTIERDCEEYAARVMMFQWLTVSEATADISSALMRAYEEPAHSSVSVIIIEYNKAKQKRLANIARDDPSTLILICCALYIVCRREGRDHHWEEWRDHLALC